MDDQFDRAITIEEEYVPVLFSLPGTIVSASSHHTQSKPYERAGYSEGLVAGRKLSAIEGRELGCEHGFDIGKDLGFYRGWAQEWLRTAAAHPDLVPVRAQKKLQAIIDAVDDVPATNDESANFEERGKAIELKFKTVSAMLGVSINAELPSNTLSF
ncbi:hypothetical protein IWW50_006393 [Coemansia erecta]|nr:hypothetical protein IWW50_006393 [Coemansia erecta]